MNEGGSCTPGCIAKILLIVGGINWGLVGVSGFMGSNWNVVNQLLGAWPQVEWFVYILVGLAALWELYSWSKCCSKK